MMDYEWRITLLEKELAHYKAMQALVAAHQDTHDTSIAALGGRMDRVEADLAETSALLKQIGQKLIELIQALERGGRNGGNGRG